MAAARRTPSRPETTPTPLSRRHVLSTAAWAVPVVAIASAAPAYAGSGTGALEPSPAPTPPPAAILALTNSSGLWTSNAWGAQHMTARTTVVNSGNHHTENLRITVTLPSPYVVRYLIGDDAVLTINNVTAGWTVGAITRSGSGSGRIATFDLTRTSPLAAQTSQEVSFRVNLGGRLVSQFTDAIALHATATGTQASASFRPSA